MLLQFRLIPSSRLFGICFLLLAMVVTTPMVFAVSVEKPTAPDNFKVPKELKEAAREKWTVAKRAWKAYESKTNKTPGKLEIAVKALNKSKSAAKKWAVPYYYLGIAYQHQRDNKKAKQVLLTAIKLNPEFHEAHVELGDTLIKLKSWKKGMTHYDKAIELAPDYANGFKSRAIARITIFGQFKEAKADLDKAIKLDSTDTMTEYIKKELDQHIKGPPWAKTYVTESENYIIKTSDSQEFSDFISQRAELIFKLYTSLFPKNKKLDRKYEILVHGTRKEYQQNGGPPGAGGHYSPIFRNLTLFKYKKQSDTLLVLNHEGWHQFIHTQLEDIPQWFNEGMGDFFGPSAYKKRKRKEEMVIKSNPWRIALIQQAIQMRKDVPISKLMLMSQREMYSGNAGLHYAQAWSLIYFCYEFNDHYYFPVLKKYFKALKAGKSQKKAFDQAFGKVNMDQFTKEWRAFITRIRS